MFVVNPRKAKKYFKTRKEYVIGPEELNFMIRRKANINIIDMRTRVDYINGHVPGAINLPRDMWDSCLGLSKNILNIVYCYSVACRMAAPIVELEGGLEAWAFYCLPVEKSARYYPLPTKVRSDNFHLEQRKLKQLKNEQFGGNILNLLKCDMLEKGKRFSL
jgi:rhodanese-related sulfurtransferase